MTGEFKRNPTQDNEQASTQQDMNYQAQVQASDQQKRPTAERPTILVNGREVPFFEAPAGQNTDAVTRLAQRARRQERERQQVDMPLGAQEETFAKARFVPMPPGGVSALVETLYFDEKDDQEAMDNHLHDILLLNRDTLRDETSYQVGQMVRIPG